MSESIRPVYGGRVRCPPLQGELREDKAMESCQYLNPSLSCRPYGPTDREGFETPLPFAGLHGLIIGLRSENIHLFRVWHSSLSRLGRTLAAACTPTERKLRINTKLAESW